MSRPSSPMVQSSGSQSASQPLDPQHAGVQQPPMRPTLRMPNDVEEFYTTLAACVQQSVIPMSLLKLTFKGEANEDPKAFVEQIQADMVMHKIPPANYINYFKTALRKDAATWITEQPHTDNYEELITSFLQNYQSLFKSSYNGYVDVKTFEKGDILMKHIIDFRKAVKLYYPPLDDRLKVQAFQKSLGYLRKYVVIRPRMTLEEIIDEAKTQYSHDNLLEQKEQINIINGDRHKYKKKKMKSSRESSSSDESSPSGAISSEEERESQKHLKRLRKQVQGLQDELQETKSQLAISNAKTPNNNNNRSNYNNQPNYNRALYNNGSNYISRSNNIRYNNGNNSNTVAKPYYCTLCQKPGHTADRCFFSRANYQSRMNNFNTGFHNPDNNFPNNFNNNFPNNFNNSFPNNFNNNSTNNGNNYYRNRPNNPTVNNFVTDGNDTQSTTQGHNTQSSL